MSQQKSSKSNYEILSKIKSIHDKIVKINMITTSLSDYIKVFLTEFEINEEINIIKENQDENDSKLDKYLYDKEMRNEEDSNRISYENQMKIKYESKTDKNLFRIISSFATQDQNNKFLKQNDLDEKFPHIHQKIRGKDLKQVTYLQYPYNGRNILRSQQKTFSYQSAFLHILNNDYRLLQPLIKFDMEIFNQMVERLNKKYSYQEIEDESIKLINRVVNVAYKFETEETIDNWPCVIISSDNKHIFNFDKIQIRIEGKNIFWIKQNLIKLYCKQLIPHIYRNRNITKNTNCELENIKDNLDIKYSQEIIENEKSTVYSTMMKKLNELERIKK